MIRVAVIDDEPLARGGVVTQLSRVPDVEVVGQYEEGTSALDGISQMRPDLLVLDVQMPGMNGMELLRALEPATRPLAILLTAHDTFAISAFELDAVDYLLKPLDDERLTEALERARTRLRRALPTSEVPALGMSAPAPLRFEVRLGRRTLFVDANQVEYFQADGDYVALHVGDKCHLLRDSLQRLQGRLDSARFMRVHRSTIVRLDRVAEMQSLSNRDALLRLHNGTLLRASRTYVELLRARLLRSEG